ncbi:MAG TPA: fibronectin type III domain-containing protein [Gaiellaceae bacterium]|nr:fibronectin type III domain-containing protein [Gaiellaceae bacterium]
MKITSGDDTSSDFIGEDTTGTSITPNYSMALGQLTLTGPDTVANFQQVLRTVLFGSGSPTTDPRTITWTVDDGTYTSSPATTTVDYTAPTIPGAPTDVSATPGDGYAVVSFTAPDDGGDPIQSYVATSSPGGITGSGPGPVYVFGLTNGVPYTFTVVAHNQIGDGPASEASNQVTPAGAPGAPTNVSAVAGDSSAVVSFDPPASDGGSPILGYDVLVSGEESPRTVAGSPATITGLTNGTSYTFTVAAFNSVEPGPMSESSNAVVPAPTPPALVATVPGAPTGVSATAGDGSATVGFLPPADDGGSAILGYTVTASPGGATATGSGSPIVVTGLKNGTPYTFTVTAANVVGAGARSSASSAVTPLALPGAPTGVSAVRGDRSAEVSFTPPASTGGSAIGSYTVTASPGGATASGIAGPLLVTGLKNGTPYTFTVTATNARGTGPSSTPSAEVTPAGQPAAPTGLVAFPGRGSATVGFVAPDPNGSPISGYTVTASPGNITASGPASPVVVTGLKNGVSYTFTVTATNGVGTSKSSAASAPVVPFGLPGAPTGVSASPGNGRALVSFTAPDDGGSRITSYTVAASGGGPAATGASSPISVSGLTNGTAYRFTVVATNASGDGPASRASDPVVPAGRPLPPTGVSATARPGSATVSFDSADDNGSPVTLYTATASPGGASASGTGSPLTITGLDPTTAYTFTVTATNAVGTSDPSAASGAVTPTATTDTTTTDTTTTDTTTTDTTATDTTATDTTATDTTSTDTTATDTTATEPLDTTTTTKVGTDTPIRILLRGLSGIHAFISGSHMKPGSHITVWAHSTPVLLGTATVGPDGSFSSSFQLPDTLEPGAHEIVVNVVQQDGTLASWDEPFTIAEGGILGTVGAVPKGILAKLPVYKVTDHVRSTLTTATAAVAAVGAAIAALGAGIGGMGLGGIGGGGGFGGGGGGSSAVAARRREAIAGSSSSGSGSSGSGSGDGGPDTSGLVGIETERLFAGDEHQADGDRSGTWRWSATAMVDRWSTTAPADIARVSPMLARVAVDGEYLRAMLGSAWLFLLPPALLLGLAAGYDTGGAAVPPTLGLFLAIMGLSVLDSLLGLAAAAGFAAYVVAAGGLQSAACVRELLAIGLVWFSLPLGAAAARPLRRRLHLHLEGLWERAADVVIGGLFAAWIIFQMLGALSGLIGYAIPVSQHAYAVSLAAVGLVAMRIGLETIAVHEYPQRLEAVRFEGEFESGLVQTLVSRVFSITLFVFFALPYMGNTWALYVGTVVCFSPILLDPIAHRLPKSRLVGSLLPNGLLKWAYVIFSGLLAAKLLSHWVSDPIESIRLGFLLLPVPFLVMTLLFYFAAEPEGDTARFSSRFAASWAGRLAGLALVLACVYASV